MHFIVLLAVGVDATVETSKAKVAPIANPVSVKVLHVYNDGNRFISMKDVIHVVLLKNVVTHGGEITPSPERSLFSDFTTWNAGRYHYSGFGGIVGQYFFPESSKPIVGVLHGIITDKYFRDSFGIESGGLPEIEQRDVHPHSLSDYNFYIRRISNVAIPQIWSLVNLELLYGVCNDFAGHGALPPSEESVNYYSQQRKPFDPNFFEFTSNIFITLGLAVGGIFFALGVMLLLFLWRRVGLYTAANMNIMLWFGLMSAAGFIWFGQWAIFSVLGLMP